CLLFTLPYPFYPLVVLFMYVHLCTILHSFPTRRSSDLLAGYREQDRSRGVRRKQQSVFDPDDVLSATALGHGGGHRDRARVGSRSEEHTSELQSRENLVCRLLLEKKK